MVNENVGLWVAINGLWDASIRLWLLINGLTHASIGL